MQLKEKSCKQQGFPKALYNHQKKTGMTPNDQ